MDNKNNVLLLKKGSEKDTSLSADVIKGWCDRFVYCAGKHTRWCINFIISEI